MKRRLSLLAIDDEAQATNLDAFGSFSTMVRGGADQWPLHQVALLAEADDEKFWLRGFGTLERSLNKQATGVVQAGLYRAGACWVPAAGG